MSAFIVEDKTINKIVTWLAYGRDNSWSRRIVEELGYDLDKPLSREKLAKDMFALNCKAVDARYGKNEAEKFRPLNFRFHIEDSGGTIPVLKAINCWHYQCSEGDEVPEHPLYKTMERLANSLAQQIVSRLPEYDHAVWG
jgi:hypothetical protein